MFVEHEKREVFPSRESSDTSLDEASKLMLKAADCIEKNGWFTFANPVGGGNCVGNQLFGLAGDNDALWKEVQRRFIASIGGKHLGDIWNWNDAPGRTKEEVVAKLRAVALGA